MYYHFHEFFFCACPPNHIIMTPLLRNRMMTIFRILFLFQNIIHIDRYQSDTYPSLPLKYVENLYRKKYQILDQKREFCHVTYCGSVNMGLKGKCFFFRTDTIPPSMIQEEGRQV